MSKKMLLALLLLVNSTRLFASHLASAEIRFEYTGVPNEYKFYLTLLKACEPGSVMLNPTEVIEISSLCGGVSQLTVYQQSVDTVSYYCPGIYGSCAVPGSAYPAYERRIYTGIQGGLIPCPDWKFSWNNCCRNAGISNLVSPASLSTYIESTLDNSVAINTSSWYPNPSPFLVTTNSVNIIPIHTVDAENDSIGIEWVNPMDYVGSTSQPVTFLSGYAFNNPLGPGSTCQIDAANQTLTVFTPNTGKYAMAVNILEFRNGIQVGSTMRDFTIVAVPGTAAQTIPMPAAGTNLHYVTCPGQSQTITLNFIDSTATDSVFLTIDTPILSGYGFVVNTVPSAGGATATISWTTPTTMDPATLPQFYFNILAQDNSCPAIASGQYAVVVQTAQCNTDSVWAGDANGDYTVNVYDPLAVAVAYGTSGTARPGATTLWQAEYCPNWGNTFYNGVDKKHSDCNGDGTVDNADLGAVTANYGLIHLKPGAHAKTSGAPDLYFDLSSVSFVPGTTASIPIMLGNSASMMNGFYGLATNITIGGVTLTSAPTISYPQSWIGNTANTLNFTKVVNGNNNGLDWAYARTNHQNTDGQGAIAMLNIPIPANASGSITLGFTGTQIIDKNMNVLTGYNVLDAAAAITPAGVGQTPGNISYAYVVPNPSANAAELQMMVQTASEINVSVTDMTGRTILAETLHARSGENKISLPAASVSSGVYFIRMENEGRSQIIKWIKQ